MSTKPVIAIPMEDSALAIRYSWISDYLELAKIRLTFMVLITTGAGFFMASSGPVDLLLMLHTLLGTAMVAFSASSLNQLLERDVDTRMERTRNRPLASGRMHPTKALIFGLTLATVGLFYLALKVNWLTSYLSLITLTTYLFLYTPLKRISSLCTVVGAVPGAIPIAMGWTASRGTLGIEPLGLFSILFLWQLPHFLAIASIYKEDYARGRFPMLPVIDKDGKTTGRQVVIHSLALVAASLLPTVLGLTGTLYLWGAALLGLGFLLVAFRFALEKSVSRARRLFLYTVIYLPSLVVWMTICKKGV